MKVFVISDDIAKCVSVCFLFILVFLGAISTADGLLAGQSTSYVEEFPGSWAQSFVPLVAEHVRDKRQATDSKRWALESDKTTTEYDDGLILVNETAELWNTTVVSDDHIYYSVTYHTATVTEFNKYWKNITDLIDKKKALGAVKHPQLANSYRRAVSTDISFRFPFYGHNVSNLTLATGGFCYLGDHMHSWLAATQYIAPLMANFDTTRKESNILYADTGSVLIIEWRNVYLRHQHPLGSFTFQVQLHKNGSIWFLYEKIPKNVKHISDAHHPRKVGLSDAYLFHHNFSDTMKSKRVIYEYHRVEISLDKIERYLVIEINAKPTCIFIDNCNSCVNASLENFKCNWCTLKSGTSFCSDEMGFHRRRQDWIKGSCKEQKRMHYCTEEDNTKSSDTHNTGTSTTTTPPVIQSSSKPALVRPTIQPSSVADHRSSRDREMATKEKIKVKKGTGVGVGGAFGILIVLVAVVGLTGWVVYAYYNPHTQSGQFLIRYRPTRWRWPGDHGDVRYTASVHM